MKELEKNVAEYLLDIICQEIPNEIDKYIEVHFDPLDKAESEESLGLFCITACKYLLADRYDKADVVAQNTMSFFNGYLKEIQSKDGNLLLHYDVVRYIAREVLDNYNERKQTEGLVTA